MGLGITTTGHDPCKAIPQGTTGEGETMNSTKIDGRYRGALSPLLHGMMVKRGGK